VDLIAPPLPRRLHGPDGPGTVSQHVQGVQTKSIVCTSMSTCSPSFSGRHSRSSRDRLAGLRYWLHREVPGGPTGGLEGMACGRNWSVQSFLSQVLLISCT